jgi:hypothetical protein
MPAQPYRIPLSEKALAAQAAAVERLRLKLAAARDQKLELNPRLVAGYAQAQRAFIEAKIEIQRLRKAGTFAEETYDEEAFLNSLELEINPPPEPEPVVEVETSPVAEAAVAEETSPARRQGRPLLSASRAFWITILVLLTSLFWFMHSPLASR